MDGQVLNTYFYNNLHKYTTKPLESMPTLLIIAVKKTMYSQNGLKWKSFFLTFNNKFILGKSFQQI